MESYRSKEDDVSRISTSIYVLNFLESFSAKDLFHSYKQYGHVVDTFIPFNRSKDGKRFGFVRFINVFNVERLKFGYNRNINNVRAKEVMTTSSSKSYVHAVKVKNMFEALECDSMPSIVLDDECLISKYLSKALLGRVKDFASLPNLKIVLKNEGFVEIKIQYMGEFWVLLEFPSSKTTELFQENMGVGSWFSELKQASFDFIPEGRIEEEGFHSKRLCIYSKPDDSDDDDESDNGFKDGDAKVQDGGSCEDDSDEVEVPETMFEESLEQKENQSKDPFGIYLLLNKNKDKSKNIKPSDHSLKYPPGFTPNGDNNEFCMHEENVRSVNDRKEILPIRVPRRRFRVRSVEGSSMNCLSLNIQGLAQKVKKDWVKELCIKNKVNFLAIQETKLENMDLWSVKACWGNYVFDFVHSDFVGNSGGILCIWDPNSFRKNNVTVLDYFCMVRGVWLKTGVDILMVVVYAPQELRDKCILWEYLEHVINQWDGEVVIMGDFNEVRFKSERFGLVFNVQGANVFNAVIANAGQEEVPLGGSSFTWCHKSATKISKLDRQFWSTIENDVFAAVSHFFTFGDIPNGCNSCFIALILKVPDANLVKDFRPISLIGSMYKIIAKILANRLVGVLGNIVNEVKSAFITEREILDGPFILNEVIQWFKLKKQQSLIFKVDFEKAYDSIRWDFLDDVLKKFGFDNKCNINTLFHVLECFFQASGLRINMCKSKIMGVNVGDEKVKSAASKLGCLILNTPFSYLGTKVKGNMSRVQAWTEVVDKVKSRLSNWKMKSLSIGEKGGLGVSSLYALNRALMMKLVWRFYSQKESLCARVIKAIYGDDGHVGKASKARSRSCWRNIVNEVRILSNQETEKEVTLNSKMSDTRLENSLCRSIRGGVEHVQFNELSDMLQSVSLMPYSDSWVWSLEGSGEFSVASIRKIIDDNRLSTVDTRTLWIKCVPIKVNVIAWKIKIEALPTRFNISRRGLRINMCKSKIMGVNVGDEKVKSTTSKLGCLILNTLFSYLGTKVGGNMSQVQAWTEVVDKVKSRLSNWKMKSLSIGETEKEVTVNSKMSDTRLKNSLRCSIRGGVEQVQFNQLSDMLQSISLMPYSDRTIWIKYVPIKVNVLAWKIKMEALPTRFNISRRGIDIDSILCPICECGVESARHVFFSCSLVRQIVRKVCSWWDVMYIDVNSYAEWFNWMNSLHLKSKSKLMIECVLYVVWWHVWTFRNKLLFEDKNPSKAIIFDDVVSRSYYW
nr:RNA-directed DNA polymerase, eukaryota, reverse transcriptase zinc-binding domain protein [Tanacetum cinerariifolium]